MVVAHIIHPRSPVTGKIMSCIKLVCENKFCNHPLRSRWFTTVASILEASDVEYEHFLREQHYIQFVVNENKHSFSIRYKFEFKKKYFESNAEIEIPLIIGTKLWLMCQNFKPGYIIDYTKFKKFNQVFEIGCPFCCVHKYQYLGCFYISNKLLHCPIFLYVDPTKLHVHRSTKKLTLVQSRKIITIPEKLNKISEEIYSWSDHFHNYAIILYAWIQVKFLREIVEHINKKNCDEPTVISIIKQIATKIQQGKVAEAVSKTTFFKTTEMGGQNHETEILFSQNLYNKDLAKSDTETRKGYFKSCSRYIQTSNNLPVMLMFAAVHCVKLISGQVLTNSHQSLHRSSIGYVCIQHTVDNKNAGMHLELIPGIHIASRFECLSDSHILFEKICTKANQLLNDDINIEREGLNKIYLYDEDMMEYTLNASRVPRLDILITEFLKDGTIPLEFYYNRYKHVGFFRSKHTSPLNSKTLYTSCITEWLLEEYPQYWYNSLSQCIKGNYPLMGIVASHGCLYNHSSTNKITAGLCGQRHAVGHPIGKNCKSFNVDRCLYYPQNDMSRREYMPIPMQTAFTALICDAGDNVEDGLSVREDLADLQFGENSITFSATITVTICSDQIHIAFPKEKGFSYIAKSIYQCSEKKKNIIHSLHIPMDIPQFLKRNILKNGDLLCDIIGVSKVKSFSTNIQSITCQSSSRILFVEPYDTGLLQSDVRKIRLLNAYATISTEINITFVFIENRVLQLGDKFSTLEGQKATVINFIPRIDMPFVLGTNPEIPVIDVLMNISATKRHTFGMFASSLIRTAKSANPDSFDLTLLMGEQSIGHHFSGPIADMLKTAQIIARKPLADGRTGKYIGEADIFLCSFIKYNQEPVKVAYFVPDDENVQRTLQGDYVLRGKGRLGGFKKSQTDTWMYLNQGMCLNIERQYQLSGEPRLVHDCNTGILKQSAAVSFKTLALHGIEMKTI